MNWNTIPLGRIFGIPIRLDYAWFLILALLTWSLATTYYPAEYGNWPVAQYWIVGALTAGLMFVSVLLHELGHAVVARYYKVPVRSITLFIFGGVAQIGAKAPTANSEFWIALAGPVTSLALAVFFGLLQFLAGAFAPALVMFQYLVYINGAVAGTLNLLAGYPLDGGRVLRVLVWDLGHNWRRATLIAANLGRVIAYLFLLLGVWLMVTGNFGNGLWLAFIGWCLESAATSQVRQQTTHDLLAGRRVADVMRRDYTVVSPGTTLEQLINGRVLGSGWRSLVVEQNAQVAGLLTLHGIKKILRLDWPTTTAAQAMIPAEHMQYIRPEAELVTALEEMDQADIHQLPVMVDKQIQGVLGRDDVLCLLRTLGEFNRK